MSAVEFGIWLQATASPTVVAGWARAAEAEGFDFVGVCDGHTIWHDPYACLTLAARETTRIRLGPWVTTPAIRHITLTASLICTLDELSAGRAFLGVGVGDESVTTLGYRVTRLDELAAAVDVVRRLWRGENVDGAGGGWQLAMANGPKPIYWACANPRSMESAGRYADGAIVSGWLIPELLVQHQRSIDAGATAAGRTPGDVARIFNSGYAIAADGRDAREACKAYVARGLCYASSVAVPGWSAADRERFIAQYHYARHFASAHELVRIVPDHLVTRKAVAGTPEECVELLQMVVDGGFDKIALTPRGDVETNIRLLARQVIPKLRLPR